MTPPPHKGVHDGAEKPMMSCDANRQKKIGCIASHSAVRLVGTFEIQLVAALRKSKNLKRIFLGEGREPRSIGDTDGFAGGGWIVGNGEKVALRKSNGGSELTRVQLVVDPVIERNEEVL